VIELVHIAKSFGGGAVLADVSLRVRPGELVCIHGPSGCGKTTLLEIIAGALAPDAGARTVAADRIGYAFQDDCLVPWLTIEENLLLVLPANAKAVTEWLETMGLADARDKKPQELSGGMKRRLNIARSLAIQPELLLLDEPFAFQDAATVDVLRERIAAAHREGGATVLVVSHDRASLAPLGGRTIEILRTPVWIEG
jgi:ABC-type nitrate/sulfonate/bicarbonate transport system ATPase subunit